MSKGTLVLCYHAVSGRWPSELAVTPEQLERQLRTLVACGYEPVTFSAAVHEPVRSGLLAVTFDDGYRSIVAEALPVLERLGIPATAFVPTDFVGAETLVWRGIERWQHGPYARELEPVNWKQLLELSEHGWEIASHTCSHARLTDLDDKELERELAVSRGELESRIGRPCRAVAYPYGAFDERVVGAARAAGYAAGATLPIRLGGVSPLTWPRIGIYRTDGPRRFRMKVSPVMRVMRRTAAAEPLLAVHELTRGARDGSRSLDKRARRRRGSAGPLVLTTDAGERSIVALTRALGTEGFRVGTIASRPWAPAHLSRFCRDRVLLADPLRDETAWLQGLERVLRARRYDIFIPGSDPALLLASRDRARLERYVRMGLPPHAVVLRTLDKLALGEAAAAAGLRAPETAACGCAREATDAARVFGFPLAVKPRRSVFEVDGALRHLPGRVVRDEHELLHVLPAYGRCVLVQRLERGQLLAYGGVIAGGQLRASALARAVRTHRPEYGSLAFAESIQVPAGLRARVEALLCLLGHEGIFELDLVDRGDGSVAVLDLNPRPYGAMALAAAGGANLAAIWCRWLLDGRTRGVDAQPGLRFRWEEADLFHLTCRIRERRVRDAAAVLLPHRHVRHAYFAATDPGPFAARVVGLVADLRRNGLRDRRETGLRRPTV